MSALIVKNKIVQMFLWLIFVSMPSIVLPGYAIYRLKEYLADRAVYIPHLVYLIVLMFAMSIGYGLTSKKKMDEFLKPKSGEKQSD
jgi:hypothetical protein